MKRTRGMQVVSKTASAYTALFALGSVLSIRRDYRAEALGMKFGWSTTKGVLSGLHGAGLAAPWNMIVQLWLAVGMAKVPGRRGRRGTAWVAFLAALFLAGSVAEPVSHKIVTAELPPPDMAVAVGNIVVPAVMLLGALVSLTEEADAQQLEREPGPAWNRRAARAQGSKS